MNKIGFLASIIAFALYLLFPLEAHADLLAADPTPPTVYYFISDLHIGGDGVMNRCLFENELIDFLRQIENGPLPAELIIVGDAFGLWELDAVADDAKFLYIARTHPKLFAQFRETGKRVRITILPGNHDYDLACWPAYKEQLSAFNLNLEPETHIIRVIAGCKIWIEHGNQYDEFNAFPDYGNRYGMPPGYFITSHVVTYAGRNAAQGKSPWLNDLQSVYPSEAVPHWIWSNYCYKELTPYARLLLLPLSLLFLFSLIVLTGRLLEKARVLRTNIFGADFAKRFGLTGRLVDGVVWVNSVVVFFILITSIPLYFLVKDIQGAMRRYGVSASEDLKSIKEENYLDAAKHVFAKDSAVALFIYGHTHEPSLTRIGSRYVLNTGSWLKRLDRMRGHFDLLPNVYYPSYHLNYFTVSRLGNGIRLGHDSVPKACPDDLTFAEKLNIYGIERPSAQQIPAETIIMPTTP